jgi:hypothetical protein
MWDTLNQNHNQTDTNLLLSNYSIIIIKTLNEKVIAFEVRFVNSTVLLTIGSINPPSMDCNANEKFMLISWLIVK